MLSEKQVKSFLILADELSFTNAAKRLSIGQQTLSSRIVTMGQKWAGVCSRARQGVSN